MARWPVGYVLLTPLASPLMLRERICSGPEADTYMNRTRGLAAYAAAGIALGTLSLSAGAARAEPPADTLRELYAALKRCVHVPIEATGSEISVAFRLKRDGSIIGSPWVTYVNASGDDSARKVFVDSVMSGLQDCSPVSITDGLGGAIAGRAMVISILHHTNHNAAGNADPHRQ
jgi:hypothetical protein